MHFRFYATLPLFWGTIEKKQKKEKPSGTHNRGTIAIVLFFFWLFQVVSQKIGPNHLRSISLVLEILSAMLRN